MQKQHLNLNKYKQKKSLSPNPKLNNPMRDKILTWIHPLAMILGAVLVLFFFSRLIDILITSEYTISKLFKGWIFLTDPEIAASSIATMLEVVTAVLGVSITVVAIVIQLSATRYTSRIIDLFITDKVNFIIFSIYIVPLVLGFWTLNSIDETFYSRINTGLFMFFSTLGIVILLPYFNYVFRFLEPENISEKIEASAKLSISKACEDKTKVLKARKNVIKSIEQLNDITLNSMSQLNITISHYSLYSIRDILEFYLQKKKQLPDNWFEISSDLLIGFSETLINKINKDRTWLEMNFFKQYELVYFKSLNHIRDIGKAIAINTRYVGQTAAKAGDKKAVKFIIKCFNTFIMYALRERDIRTLNHLFYQYRLFTENITDIMHDYEILEEIATHFNYYALMATQDKRNFIVLESVTYDLRSLNEYVYNKHPKVIKRILNVFLLLDDKLRGLREEMTFLPGVRKSQAMLAGFYIQNNRKDLAEKIYHDMKIEDIKFLESVKEDLFKVRTSEFWEIEDRGVSFYYLEEDKRKYVEEFFDWFKHGAPN